MGTKDFNFIDKIIANWRLSKIIPEIANDDVVLDFGCGSQGYFLRYIREKIKSGVGVDYDVENHIYQNLEFLKLKVSDGLEFNNKTFDKIVMLAVLEHLELNRVDNIFAEFRRILKDGGRLVLTTPTPKSKFILETLARFGIISRSEIADHKKYYDFAGIKQLAKTANFTIVSYKLFQMGLNSVVVLQKN